MERELLRQGIENAKQGNYGVAIGNFTQVIEINSSATEAYYRRGLAYYDSGDLENAIADYDRSLNINSQQIDVYFARALAFLNVGNIQGSIIDLQIILELDINYALAYQLRGNILIKSGQFDCAIEDFKQAGKIYLDRQDKENCRRCIAKIRALQEQKIIDRGGFTNSNFLEKIQLKIQQGQLSEALADCNWLLQLDPHDAQAYYYRGTIDLQLGKYEAAKTDLRQAVEYFRSQGNIAESEKIERFCWQLRLSNINFSSIFPVPTQLKNRQSNYLDRPENAIQNRLCMLVGDWNIAINIVEKLKTYYPGQSETWYWEKAIRDLENERF
jgi:tetratricopeptide (TPR) repeat protein